MQPDLLDDVDQDRGDTPAQHIVPGRIDVWIWDLDVTEPTRDTLASTLCPAETHRARRFVRPRDQQHFVVGRGRMREILARYHGVAPRDLRFAYNQYGKPSLVAARKRQLSFNLSHSGAHAALVITGGADIGVDLEFIKAFSENVSFRFFSPDENAALQRFAGQDYLHAFFRCWTRKEAFVKADGKGLSQALDSFDVTVAPDDPPRLIRLEGHPDPATDWSILNLEVPDGYVGAVAVRSAGLPMRLRYCAT